MSTPRESFTPRGVQGSPTLNSDLKPEPEQVWNAVKAAEDLKSTDATCRKQAAQALLQDHTTNGCKSLNLFCTSPSTFFPRECCSQCGASEVYSIGNAHASKIPTLPHNHLPTELSVSQQHITVQRQHTVAAKHEHSVLPGLPI